jgi:hypothetical protein
MDINNVDLYKRVSAFLEVDVKNWSYIQTIEELLNMAQGFQNENGLMAEKAAEKEQAFGEFMQIIDEQKTELALYKLQETKLLAQLAVKEQELKALHPRYKVYKENLALAEEIALLKEGVKA